MFEKLKSIAKNIKLELKVWRLVLKDSRTPLLAKILLGAAIAYVLLPFDILPDIVPGIGYLDDILIVALLVFIALKMIPKEVVEDCRLRAQYKD